MENVITLGKLIGMSFLFCPHPLSLFCFQNTRNELACPVMGIISLVILMSILGVLHAILI